MAMQSTTNKWVPSSDEESEESEESDDFWWGYVPATPFKRATYRGVEIIGDDEPMYHSSQPLEGEQLRHAVEVGTIDGVVPEFMEDYNKSVHGKYDIDAYREAVSKGYSNYTFSYRYCPKVFLKALELGFDNNHHWSAGPDVYLRAVALGFDPEKHECPRQFLQSTGADREQESTGADCEQESTGADREQESPTQPLKSTAIEEAGREFVVSWTQNKS